MSKKTNKKLQSTGQPHTIITFRIQAHTAHHKEVSKPSEDPDGRTRILHCLRDFVHLRVTVKRHRIAYDGALAHKTMEKATAVAGSALGGSRGGQSTHLFAKWGCAAFMILTQPEINEIIWAQRCPTEKNGAPGLVSGSPQASAAPCATNAPQHQSANVISNMLSTGIMTEELPSHGIRALLRCRCHLFQVPSGSDAHEHAMRAVVRHQAEKLPPPHRTAEHKRIGFRGKEGDLLQHGPYQRQQLVLREGGKEIASAMVDRHPHRVLRPLVAFTPHQCLHKCAAMSLSPVCPSAAACRTDLPSSSRTEKRNGSGVSTRASTNTLQNPAEQRSTAA
eukprot:gene2166-1335_t